MEAFASLRRSVGVAVQPRTYRHVAYLLVSIPLGFLYWTVLFVGTVLGAALSIVLVGLAILVAMVPITRTLAGLERVVTSRLLGIELATPSDRSDPGGDGVVAAVRRSVNAASTWRQLGYLLVKFPFAVLALVVVIGFATALSLLVTPIYYPHEVELFTVNDTPVTWTIDSVADLAFAIPLGAGLTLACLHAANGFAFLSRRLAAALLDG